MELVAFFAYRIVSVSISTRIAASLVISGASGHSSGRCACMVSISAFVAALVAWHGSKRRHMHRHKEKEEHKTVFINNIHTFP